MPNLDRFAKELQDLKFAIDQAAIVTITSPDGRIIYANDKMLEVSKYSRSEIIGKSHRELKSGMHSEEFYKNLWDTLLAGKIWQGEICNKAKDGSLFWVDTTIVPFLADNGRPYQFMSIRKDITEKKRAELELEQERAKHLYMDRLSAIGEMAAGIAHEIKNPLAVILLQAQLLKRCTGRDNYSELSLRAAERIESTVRRIEKIIKSVQVLARNAEADPIKQVRASSLFEDIQIFSHENLAKLRINLIVEPCGGNIPVMCRSGQISQVLLNLVNNARDAVEHLDERWIRLAADEDEEWVYLSVTDSGQGVPMHIRPRLMEPFFSTKGLGRGTGIGLSISKKIVEGHGGSLFLDTSRERTRFVCKLPRKQPAVAKKKAG